MATPDENVSDQLRRLLEQSGSTESKLTRFSGYTDKIKLQTAKVAAGIKSESFRKSIEAVDSSIAPLSKLVGKLWDDYRLRGDQSLRGDLPIFEYRVTAKAISSGGSTYKGIVKETGLESELAKQVRDRFGVKFAPDIHDSAGTYRAHRLLTDSGKATDVSEIMRHLDYLSPTMRKKIEGWAELREIEKINKKGKKYTKVTQQLELAMTKLVEEDIRHQRRGIEYRWDQSDLAMANRADRAKLGRMKTLERAVVAPGGSFNPTLRNYEQELSRATRLVSEEKFNTIVFGGEKITPSRITPEFGSLIGSDGEPIGRPLTGARGKPLTTQEKRLAKLIEGPVGSRPSNIGMYRETRIGLAREEFQSTGNLISELESRGYSTGGLDKLLSKVVGREDTISIVGNELAIKSAPDAKRGWSKPISIPLFSNAINPSGARSAANLGVSEYMFKGGTTYSTPSGVGVTNRRGELSEIKKFSRVIYEEIAEGIDRNTIRSTKDYNFILNRALGAQESIFDPILPWDERVKNTAGLIDPVSYSGRPKLGRHLLGASQQMALEVLPGTSLHNLLVEEQEIRKQYQMGMTREGTDGTGKRNAALKAKQLKDAQEAIMKHLRETTFKGASGDAPALGGVRNFDDLNLAWAPQSGESIFRPNILDENRAAERVYIKATTANVKNLALLPSQVPWKKGQQFQLSRDAIRIGSISELPTAVAGIMGYDGEVTTALRNEIRSLDPGAKAFDQTHVAFGRKTVGLQFLDKELNRLIFGDSGVVMSGGLVKQLDVDPISGLSRHTFTHTINLKSSKALGDLSFTGLLRSDLHAAIQAHQHMLERGSRQIRFKPGQEIQLQVLQEHQSMSGIPGGVNYAEPAIPMDPTKRGMAVIGEGTKALEEIGKEDLRHAHDLQRAVQKRGFDPSKTVITGVRMLAGSSGLELTMAEKGAPIAVDAGYILDHQRVSVGQVIDDTAVRKIFGLAGVKGIEAGAGLVLGDLGLETVENKMVRGVLEETPSYGRNLTLMRNLAELISRKAKGDVGHKDVKTLIAELGGEVKKITGPDGTAIQFQNLGTSEKFHNISDQDFMRRIEEVAKKTIGKDTLRKETFKKVKIQDILDQLPAYKTADAAERKRMEAGFKASGASGSTAAILKDSRLASNEVWMVKSIAAELAIRGEEPLVKLGRDAVNVKLRDISMLGEAIDFAREGQTSTTNLSEILKAKKKIVGSLIDSNPELLQVNNENSLINQQRKWFEKQAGGFGEIERALADEKVGQLKILKKAEQIGSGGRGGVSTGEYKAAGALIESITVEDGKASFAEIGETLLGKKANGIVQISDQAILVKGPNGPMIIPSAKMMGFAKEDGFVRIPGTRGRFEEHTAEAFAHLKKGRVANKQAQSMYLDILRDVENLNLLEGERRIQDTVKIESRLDSLYRVMAMNSLSKQGLAYSSTVDPSAIKFGGRLRLQTNAQVGKFEVGITEDALRNMSFGGKHTEIERIIAQAKKGELYTTAVREPAAGGRQMFQLKVKLLEKSALASESITKDFKFSSTAFLNTSMIQYGMEGDLDKDTISLYRLNSMDDEVMGKMHRGQMASMDNALSKLGEAPETIAGRRIRNYGDLSGLISSMNEGAEGVFRSSALRDETFRSLIDVVGPKHATPLYEGHLRGRSYVDHMVGQIVDMQTDGEGRAVLQANLKERLDESGQQRIGALLDDMADIMKGSGPGTRGGRAATYQYTDARNLIKYMQLKKVAHGRDDVLASDVIYDTLRAAGDQAKADIDAGKSHFAQGILDRQPGGTSKAQAMISTLSENLLVGARIAQDDKMYMNNLSEVNPNTFSLIHNLSGGDDAAKRYAENLAKRFLLIEVMGEEFKHGTRGTALGMPFESTLRDMKALAQSLVESGVISAEGPAALQLADIQGMGGEADAIIGRNIRDSIEGVRVDTQQRRRVQNADKARGALFQSGNVEVPTSSYRNAMFTGEFFAKLSQTKYFKPAAAIVGGLAGIETIRSAMSGFSPGSVPASGYNSANTMPPPPMMSSPHDPTFHPDAMPNTRIARVARSQGARSSLNISGKMGAPPDFRGMTNQFGLNNGYVPNIQGSFRSELNDTMSRTEISQHISNRLDSVF
jgi:hypothetical protein